MKKIKIITISILGLLLLVPFMTPTRAQPASYVGVAEEEKYEWELSVYLANWVQWGTDNMSDTLANVFNIDAASDFNKLWGDWSWDATPPQSIWPITVNTILPENTSMLMSDFFIFDSITATPVYLDAGFEMPDFPAGNLYYSDTWYIVNNTVSFAAQTLYGGLMTTPYWLMGAPFGPKNINWTVYAGWANWGMSNYWTAVNPLAANTSVSEITDGFSMSVPISGYENNSQAITINTTYNSNGILTYHSFEYGANMLFDYILSSTSPGVDPVATVTPSDLNVAHNYTGQSLSWTATDAHPSTYTITLNGTTTVVAATAWSSGGAITYNIPDGLAPGIHTYEITFSDINGNTISDTATMTVNPASTPPPETPETPETPAIPGFDPLFVIGFTTIASIGLIILKKKRK